MSLLRLGKETWQIEIQSGQAHTTRAVKGNVCAMRTAQVFYSNNAREGTGILKEDTNG
jgi:hypothetical protein